MNPVDFLSGLAGIFAKYAPVPMLAVAVSTTTLLLLPEPVVADLGMTEFVAENRGVIAGAALFSWAYFVALAVVRVWKWTGSRSTSWWGRRSRRSRGRKHLLNLNPDEAQILHFFVANRTRGQRLPFQSGVVRSLEADQIIGRVSNMLWSEWDDRTQEAVVVTDYIIQPWAWDFLHEHPECFEEPGLLDGPRAPYL